jgi:hypothetical protein
VLESLKVEFRAPGKIRKLPEVRKRGSEYRAVKDVEVNLEIPDSLEALTVIEDPRDLEILEMIILDIPHLTTIKVGDR